jgi:hypothetical protein
MAEIFSARRAKREQAQEALQAQRYQQIGHLKGALDGLKKKRAWPPDAQRECIEPAPPPLSMARQWDLVGLPRSTSYYPVQGESPEHRLLMRLRETP